MKEMAALHMDDGLNEVNMIQLVGMKLGEEEYAIDVLKIQEIIRTMEITIVPRSDSFILGVINLRGRVIPVIDLRVRFNLEKMDFDKDTRIIVVRFEKEQIGFVVDEVTQVIRISQNMVEPTPPLVGAIGQEYILGICKYSDRLIILLDIDRVINKSSSMMESDLRKKLTGSDKRKKGAVNKPQAILEAPAKAAAPAAAPVKAYSMADEADAMSKPLITMLDDDEEDEDDARINAVLNGAMEQGSAVTRISGNEVQQGDLDSLIAAELKIREAETEELNKAKKAAATQPAATSQPAATAEEEALSMDELIAIELSKREAETDELNKKNAASGDKKKNELDEPEHADEMYSIQLSSDGLVPDEDAPASNPDDYAPTAKELAAAEDMRRETNLADLKEVARRIISGESNALDLGIKGEFGELIRLLVDIKNRVDEIPPAVTSSQTDLPNMSSTLTDVDTFTEKAAFNLLANAQKMGDFYNTLQTQIENLEKAVKSSNKDAFSKEATDISTQVGEADELGFHILEALEFQDITEQKLRKVLGSIQDVGARLGVIVGYIKSKDDSGTKDKAYDHVLTDLGFA
jgi:chemotaxis signal transduction protein/chemotaxis regulatin CheY-phosphate phosphatase CheZ